MSTRRPELAQSELIEELPAACASENVAVEFLEHKRWGDCPCCVHCGSVNVYSMRDSKTGERNKRFLWRCRDCEKQYTVRVGTIFEDSGIPLHKWCRAYWEAGTGKNGVSALEISRKLQISYKSALFVMHRIRFAMTDDHSTPPKMEGTVEADETYVGGKPRNPISRFERRKAKWLGKPIKNDHKVPVVAAVQRGGAVRARVIADVTGGNVVAFLRQNVAKSAVLMTDESPRYRVVGKDFAAHYKVEHAAGEYVRYTEGVVAHSNTVEGFFSKVKRGLNGVFHAVSKEHLPRYIGHFEYLYNTRTMNDGERVLDLIRRSDGKRLTENDYRSAV